jgi:parallel beta-helix repeat protein
VLDANDLHDNQEGIRAETRSPSGQIFPPPNQPRIEPRIVNNLIRDHRADGIALLTGRSQPQVLNNTLLRNTQAGIYHLAGVSGEGRIRNNLVVGNGRGLVGNATSPPPTNAVAFNNAFGNGQNWVSHPPGYGQTSRTNASGRPVDLADNLSLDPGLGGPDGAHLLPGSPMIDAGSALQAPPPRPRRGTAAAAASTWAATNSARLSASRSLASSPPISRSSSKENPEWNTPSSPPER